MWDPANYWIAAYLGKWAWKSFEKIHGDEAYRWASGKARKLMRRVSGDRDDAIPRAALDRPPIHPLPAYTEDFFPEYCGIRWKWSWLQGVVSATSTSDIVRLVTDLRPHCPLCDRRLTVILGLWGKVYRNARSVKIIDYKCDAVGCGFRKILNGPRDKIERGVKVSIEQEAHARLRKATGKQ